MQPNHPKWLSLGRILFSTQMRESSGWGANLLESKKVLFADFIK